MRTRRQAEPEQQDEPEEREEEIVYEVRENVDDLFEGYREGTKIIVVAFEDTHSDNTLNVKGVYNKFIIFECAPFSIESKHKRHQ